MRDEAEVQANSIDLETESPALMTEEEVAGVLRIKVCTVRNERKRKRLEFIRVGSRVRISKIQFRNYLQRQSAQVCETELPVPIKSENTGSARSRGAKAPMILGAVRPTTNTLDKRVMSALARQTFKKHA